MSTESNHNNMQGQHCHSECTLKYVEQIATNKANIGCLSGRVDRVEAEIRDRYTKEELDRMLAGKADKCAFEKHLTNPCAHKGIACGNDCIEPCLCDCYTKAEVDALLENKVTGKAPPKDGLKLYVRVNGNDVTGDGTELNPFLSVERAVKELKGLYFSPQSVSVIIDIGVGTFQVENLVLYNIPFSVMFRGVSETDTILVNNSQEYTLNIGPCCALIAVDNLTIEGVGTMINNQKSNMQISKCHFIRKGESNGVAIHDHFGKTQVWNCHFEGHSNCVSAIGGGMVVSQGNTGSNNQVAFRSDLSIILDCNSNIGAATNYVTSQNGCINPMGNS